MKKQMKITTLEQLPHLFDELVHLIETSFQYPHNQSFEVDFYPLLVKNNWNQLYIGIIDHKVVCHIGVLDKKFKVNGNYFKCYFIGGIATHQDFQKKGLFSQLMNYVLNEIQDSALAILWSENNSLYKKFSFHLCSEQFVIPKIDSIENKKFYKTQYHLLTDIEKKQISKIYQEETCKNFISCIRTNREWQSIEQIKSSQIFIKKDNDIITDYFFMNKGADLKETIHEYGSIKKINLNEISQYGNVWIPRKDNTFKDLSHQFGFHCKMMNQEMFSMFIQSMTKGLINISSIEKDVVTFSFENKVIQEDIEPFFHGVFGPHLYKEIEDKYPLFYISGLDSI